MELLNIENNIPVAVGEVHKGIEVQPTVEVVHILTLRAVRMVRLSGLILPVLQPVLKLEQEFLRLPLSGKGCIYGGDLVKELNRSLGSDRNPSSLVKVRIRLSFLHKVIEDLISQFCHRGCLSLVLRKESRHFILVLS